MRKDLQQVFDKEMHLATAYYAEANWGDCFHHLERAHILGQRSYFPHVKSHWWMLKVGWKRSDPRELVGQLLRILASAGSLLGWVPEGNTGGANVSALAPMPTPDDLALLLEWEQKPSIWRAAARLLIFLVAIAGASTAIRRLF